MLSRIRTLSYGSSKSGGSDAQAKRGTMWSKAKADTASGDKDGDSVAKKDKTRQWTQKMRSKLKNKNKQKRNNVLVSGPDVGSQSDEDGEDAEANDDYDDDDDDDGVSDEEEEGYEDASDVESASPPPDLPPRTPESKLANSKLAAKPPASTSKSKKSRTFSRMLRRSSSNISKERAPQDDDSSVMSGVSSQGGGRRSVSSRNPFRMMRRLSKSSAASRASDEVSSIGGASQASKSSRGSFFRRGGSFLWGRSRRAEAENSKSNPSHMRRSDEEDEEEDEEDEKDADLLHTKGMVNKDELPEADRRKRSRRPGNVVSKTSDGDKVKDRKENEREAGLDEDRMSGASEGASNTTSVTSNRIGSFRALRKATPMKLAKRAGKAVGKFGSGSLIRLRGLQHEDETLKHEDKQANSKNKKIIIPKDEIDDDEEDSLHSGGTQSTGLSVAKLPLTLFTQHELSHLRAISGEATYEILVDVLGNEDKDESRNPLLMARLADLVGDESEHLHEALALLRSSDAIDRLAVLYHLHNLHDHPEGPSADDLRCVLRHTPALRRTMHALNTQEGEQALEKFEPLVPRLRLEAFYLTHSPERLTRLDAIQEKYKGRENILWKKLAKQFDGHTVPSEDDVLPILTILPLVESFVAQIMGSRSNLSFESFVGWISTLHEHQATFRVPVQIPKIAPSWDVLLNKIQEEKRKEYSIASSLREENGLGDWLRFAVWPQHLRGRKLRLSDLPFRRRWCRLKRNPNGMSTLEIFRDDHDTHKTLQEYYLTSESTSVELIERPDHKHQYSIFLPEQRVFIQLSRNSSVSLPDWLAHLRAATHQTINLTSTLGSFRPADLETSGSLALSQSMDGSTASAIVDAGPNGSVAPRSAISHVNSQSNQLRGEEESPRDTSESPRDTSESPRDTSESPRDTSESPRDTSAGEDDESDYSDEDASSRDERAEEVRTRIEAFYMLHNPEKIAKLDRILLKYDRREDDLVRDLEKTYPGKTVPSYEDAERLLQEYDDKVHLTQEDHQSIGEHNDEESESNRSGESDSGSDSGSEIIERNQLDSTRKNADTPGNGDDGDDNDDDDYNDDDDDDVSFSTGSPRTSGAGTVVESDEDGDDEDDSEYASSRRTSNELYDDSGVLDDDSDSENSSADEKVKRR